MSTDYNVNPLQGIPSSTEINDNFNKIEGELDKKLDRRSRPDNEMQDALDMNSFSIYNLPAPNQQTEPVRLAELGALSALFDDVQVSELASYYEFTGDGSTTRYDLVDSGNALDPAAYLVAFDGAVQSPAGWELILNGSYPTLVFDSAPANGTAILIIDFGLTTLAGAIAEIKVLVEGIRDVASALVAPYHISFAFDGGVETGKTITSWVCPLDFHVNYPEGIANTGATIAEAPTSELVFDINRNGNSVGTITFAAGSTEGDVAATLSSFTVTGYDVLSISAQGDYVVKEVSVTLAGQRTPWIS